MQLLRAAFLILLFTVCQTTMGASMNYYVAQGAKNASDENPGTEKQPFLTIGKAAAVAQGGDTVYIKAGIYRESINLKHSGAGSEKRIAFCAFAEDSVIIRGTDPMPASEWTQVKGTNHVYRSKRGKFKSLIGFPNGSGLPQAQTNRASWFEVFVDGLRVMHHNDNFTCGDKWVPPKHIAEPKPLSDSDTMKYFLDVDGTLYLNTGDGNPADNHSVETTARLTAIRGDDWLHVDSIRLSGLHVDGFGYWSVLLGAHCLVEDCLFTNNGCSAWVGRDSTIQRCTAKLDGGGSLRAYGGTVQNCLIIEGQAHPTFHTQQWTQTATLSGRDATVRYNIAVGVGMSQLHKDVGWTSVLWGDIGPYMGAWYGNALWHNTSHGIYLEERMSQVVLMYNVSAYNGAGIVLRASQRNYILHNWFHHDNLAIAVWTPFTNYQPGYATKDNVIRRNLITDCPSAIEFAPGCAIDQWPSTNPKDTNGNLIDENWYNQPAPRFKWGNKNDFKDFAAFQKFTGQETKAIIKKDVTPEDAGLRLVWFRVPGFPSRACKGNISKPAKPIAMIGNPYLGNLAPTKICNRESFDPRAIEDPSNYTGLYFWSSKDSDLASVSLPCVPDTKVTVSAKVRGEKVKWKNPDGRPAVQVHFVSATGQHHTVVDVPLPELKNWNADFDWREIRGAVTVPKHARWWQMVITSDEIDSGKVVWDDVHMGVE